MNSHQFGNDNKENNSTVIQGEDPVLDQQEDEDNDNQLTFSAPGIQKLEIVDPRTLANMLELKQKITKSDAAELTYLMYHILNFPSLVDAQSHSQASRLGGFDIDNATKQNQTYQNRQYCRCCGYLIQVQPIPLCTPFDAFPGVGISTYLFFQTIKNLIFLLLFVCLAHSTYALITNLHAAGVLQGNKQITIDNIISWVSLDSKVVASNTVDSQNVQNLHLFYMIEMWIGVGVVILWSLILYLIKYFQRKYQVMVDKETISAADFSIIIQNYPDNLTKDNLQKQLTAYAQKLDDIECSKTDYFKIQKMSLSIDSSLQKQDQQQMQGINEKYFEMLDMFADWICQFQENNGLPFQPEKRKKIYQKFHKIKNQRFVKGRRLLHTMYKSNKKNSSSLCQSNLAQMKQTERKRSKSKTIAIVTFKYSNSKDLISKHNSMDFAKKIRHFIRCCPTKNKLVLMDESKKVPIPYQNIIIQKAPQPEDIKWENLSVSTCEKVFRKAGTYLATLVLLSASFALVYILSMQQLRKGNNFFLSMAISVTISLINFIIGFIIRFMTIFEKDYTQTGYQTSLAIKSICAQLINSIVVPLIVNYIIEGQNIFGPNGLSTDIINLSITNSLLSPLSKLVDPYFRYIVLRAYYYRKILKQRLLMKQVQLNDSQQLMEFETGYEYIYFINLYLFTAFFVTLQPCIAVTSIVGMFMMYWIHKYSLLNRMKRPVPGTDLINAAMGQMVSLGPIFFALGALCWSHLLDGYKVKQGIIADYVPNIIAGGFAALFFIFPFSIIFDKCLPKVIPQKLDYQQCRIILNSQYDRTNPATMEQAIKEYEEYLQSYMKNAQGQQQTQKQINSFQSLINNQEQQNQEKHKKNVGFHITDLESQNDNKQVPSQKKDSIIRKQIKLKSKINMNSISNESNQTLKDIQINKQFLSLKKEILRNKTRLRSKLNQNNNFSNLVGEFVGRYTKNQTGMKNDVNGNKLDNINQENQQQQCNQQALNIDKVHSQLESIGTQNQQNKNNEMQQLTRIFIKPGNHKQPRKQREQKQSIFKQLENQQKLKLQKKQTKPQTNIKTKKESEYKNNKLDLKFKEFFPYENSEACFENSPQNTKNDGYMNFFGKTAVIQIHNTENNKIYKQVRQRGQYKNNPYDRAFS